MISLIVAKGNNNEIGNQGKIPWHLPNDFKWFKKVTLNSTIVMGRKTYESIGRPLPSRKNVVISSNTIDHDQVMTYHYPEKILSQYSKDDNIFIIGGSKIYEYFLPHVTHLFITEVDGNFKSDVYFPKIDLNDWNLVYVQENEIDEKHEYPYTFKIYTRKGFEYFPIKNIL